MSESPTPAEPSRGAHLQHPTGAGELVVLRTAEQTDGVMIEVEAICYPGPPGVEERSFSAHDVSFEVLEGRLTIGTDGAERLLRPGEAAELPAGMPHRIWVESDAAPARFIWQMRPAPMRPDYLGLLFGTTDPISTEESKARETGAPHV